MNEKKFQKRVEDFCCENCNTRVTGTGYTNHCPKCLFSKHVDNFPGDRQNECGGMMHPIRVEKKKNDYVLIHRCVLCGEERKNRVCDDDDFNQIVNLCSKM